MKSMMMRFNRPRGNSEAETGNQAQPAGLRPPLAWVLVLCVCGCGASRIDQLLESVRSADVDQQRQALRELAELGAEGTPAIPDLVELCADPDPDIRRLAGLALANIAGAIPSDGSGTQREEIVDVRVEQLGDEDAAVRNTAAFGLLALDPGYASAQQHLLDAMQAGDGGIIDRLTRTQPPPTWAVPTLIQILNRDERPGLRRLSAVALGAIDPGSDEAQDALQGALQDSDDRVRDAAEHALGDASR